jgi:hypothetical protein
MSRKGKENVDLGVKEIDSEHDLMLGLVRALEGAVTSASRPQVQALLQSSPSSRESTSRPRRS